MSRPYKILVAHTHFPVTIARYWKNGLRQAGHTVDSIGYCTGAAIPWPGNPRLPNYIDNPTYPIYEMRQRYQIDDHLREIASEYDFFLNVDAAYYWQGDIGIPKVIIGTDPHCLDYSDQRTDCDLFVCMQKGYSRPTDTWIPYAYDHEIHWDHQCDRTFDVAFVGVEYANRTQDLNALAASGLTVHREVGKAFYEFADLISQSKFSYCTPSLQDLPARFFESMACHSVPISTRIREMSFFPDLQEGVHYLAYGSQIELIGKVRRLLLDEKARLEMVRAGSVWVKDHTWQNRAETLVGTLENKLGWSQK